MCKITLIFTSTTGTHLVAPPRERQTPRQAIRRFGLLSLACTLKDGVRDASQQYPPPARRYTVKSSPISAHSHFFPELKLPLWGGLSLTFSTNQENTNMEQYMEQFTFFGVTFYQYPELMEQWTSGPVLSNDYPLLVKKDGKFLNTETERSLYISCFYYPSF